MRRTTASIRKMYLNHATANLIRIDAPGDSPALEAHTQRIYALHSAQGIPDEILQKLWRLLDAFLTGFLFNEIQEINSHRSKHGMPKTAWHETVAGAYSQEAFEDGVNIILAGVREMCAPDPCNWHTPE